MERYGVLVARRALGKDCGTAGWAVCVHNETVHDLLKIAVNKIRTLFQISQIIYKQYTVNEVCDSLDLQAVYCHKPVIISVDLMIPCLPKFNGEDQFSTDHFGIKNNEHYDISLFSITINKNNTGTHTRIQENLSL